jgi:hypothetical protein
MSQNSKTNSKGKQVAVVVGATSKWQSNGRNTLLAHGRMLDDSGLPVGARWGVGAPSRRSSPKRAFSLY